MTKSLLAFSAASRFSAARIGAWIGAIHLKLDELIRSIHQAHNEMIDIEKLSDAELDEFSFKFGAIRAECNRRKRVETCCAPNCSPSFGIRWYSTGCSAPMSHSA